eukprot:GHVP01008068.1.p1 GENE.GHVP01008068.1~~GHVP01008068.1.p1  ORF type:complete len:116 (-),score=17.40 GHVP01008068.1:215-562(-)
MGIKEDIKPGISHVNCHDNEEGVNFGVSTSQFESGDPRMHTDAQAKNPPQRFTYFLKLVKDHNYSSLPKSFLLYNPEVDENSCEKNGRFGRKMIRLKAFPCNLESEIEASPAECH